jgi:hypothetical protein
VLGNEPPSNITSKYPFGVFVYDVPSVGTAQNQRESNTATNQHNHQQQTSRNLLVVVQLRDRSESAGLVRLAVVIREEAVTALEIARNTGIERQTSGVVQAQLCTLLRSLLVDKLNVISGNTIQKQKMDVTGEKSKQTHPAALLKYW